MPTLPKDIKNVILDFKDQLDWTSKITRVNKNIRDLGEYDTFGRRELSIPMFLFTRRMYKETHPWYKPVPIKEELIQRVKGW